MFKLKDLKETFWENDFYRGVIVGFSFGIIFVLGVLFGNYLVWRGVV